LRWIVPNILAPSALSTVTTLNRFQIVAHITTMIQQRGALWRVSNGSSLARIILLCPTFPLAQLELSSAWDAVGVVPFEY
jgi:hypothetical protein